ncbi:hypothetical protein VNO80_02272 [Phaseolus coccineus]|uniref:TF-B3 domain-containing protein n=1 Tax=Phaseolus coccineus TaxID=3886 RepID=A0AAN9NQZ1_PHACN
MEEGHIPSNAGVKCASPERSVHANGTKEPINVPFETPTPSEEALNADVESGGAEQVTSVGIPLSAVPTETANGKRIRKLVSAVKHVQTKRRGRPAKVSHVMDRAQVMDRALDWVSGEHISPMSQDVILRMGKGEWIARYSYHNIRHTGGFTGGWKHFVLDNNLEEPSSPVVCIVDVELDCLALSVF